MAQIFCVLSTSTARQEHATSQKAASIQRGISIDIVLAIYIIGSGTVSHTAGAIPIEVLKLYGFVLGIESGA
jgi:hypothetical protein